MKITCSKCGYAWEPTDKAGKKIEEAAKSNAGGPYCHLCLYLEMALRHANARGLKLSFQLEPHALA